MRRALVVVLVVALAPLVAGIGRAAAPPPSGMIYVPVADGTEIALRVFYPSNYAAGGTYPALVQAEGYGGASSPNDSSFVGKPDYVVVGISLRGTGCSGGQLELFGEQSSKDVAWIIDNWIPNQPWSNGDVGIYGHSYGGLTGFLVAAEHPTHLRAVAVSGLIDDFYRGILYPGGVSNYGFPILWGALLRPISEHQSNQPYITDLNNPHCAQNYAQHQGTDLAPQATLFLDTYGSPFAAPDSWAITHALLTHIGGINVPIQLGQQYQDEQTGPRGGHVLWENLPAGVPKRITISTGMHNPNDPTGNKRDWFDCWILGAASGSGSGRSCADVKNPAQRVLLYFESEGASRLAPFIASDWPLPTTDVNWTRYYLRADGRLNTIPGAPNEAPGRYVSTGTGRHMTLNMGHALPLPTNDQLAPYGFTTGLPDTARYTLDFGQTTAVAGPIDLTLYAQLSSPDTDFWAEILDYDPATKATTFVQRGLLRASFNATFDSARSQRTPGGDIYRPYYTYSGISPVVPNSINRYEVEIFPLGHVWRAGHQLVLQLHAPPASDPISIYQWEPNLPGAVTILQDAAHPTSILLPVMRTLPPIRSSQPACGAVIGEGCVTPALG